MTNTHHASKKRMKSVMLKGTSLLKTFSKNGNNMEVTDCLNNANVHSAFLIRTVKHSYYIRMSEKPESVQRSSKRYWSLLKCSK